MSWTDKLSEQIKDIVALVLARRVKDPRLGFVTITAVKVTGDGREATIFYTVLDGADEVGSAAALESAKGMLRTAVSKKLEMKFAPTLAFVRDAVPTTSKEMEELLARVQASDAALAEQRVDATYAGDADPYRKPADETDESN